MMSKDIESRYVEALTTVRSVVDAALGPNSDEIDRERPASRMDVGCSIKSLPSELVRAAASTAKSVNPLNSPIVNSFPHTLRAGGRNVVTPLHLALLTTKYWGRGPISLSVSFLEPTDGELQNRIVSHMNAWSESADIRFMLSATNGLVRVLREHDGYWSYLGVDVLHVPQSQPTMNLDGFTMNTPESEFRRVVRHEAGHVLGFAHEHMRSEVISRIDPERAYQYFASTQGWDRQTVDEQVLTPLNRDDVLATDLADEESVMCYQLPASITRDGSPILGGRDINELDYAFAGRIYPKLRRTTWAARNEYEPASIRWDFE